MDLRLFLEEIARGAGEITLQYFNNPDLEIITKSDESPVTRADRESEQYLRKRIRERFPNDTILGEEFGTDGSDATRRWILDPIDGTKSFIHGVPLYGVLIGFEENGKVTSGVTYMPALNEMVSAGVGQGCYWNGKRCHVSKTASLSEALTLTTEDPRLRSLISESVYDQLIGGAKLYRTWGDCYGHILVATGRADLMIDPRMALWDVAPLGVIVEEAGGRSMDINGNPTIYNGSLVSSNAALGTTVKEILAGNA